MAYHADVMILWISLPFEHCVFYDHGFSITGITGRNFLCVELRENYTARSPEAV